jgi:hypothetical protein
MEHHVDRFYSAALVLAGNGHIKQRLVNAYEANIEGIDAGDLPEGLRDNFVTLRDRLHCEEPVAGEGPVSATVRKMSVDEASRCAQTMLSLYSELMKLRVTLKQAPRTEQADDAAPKQPVLVKSVG